MGRLFQRGFSGLGRGWSSVAVASLALFVLCLLIGGASQRHALRLALLELAALPVLGLALVGLVDQAARSESWLSRHRFALGIATAAVAVPLIQLIPLPPEIWTSLPGREPSLLALEVTGVAPGWSTLSLTPDLTWQSWLALLPPVAVFLGLLAAGAEARRQLAPLLLILTAAAVGLGLAQVASGGRFHLWPTSTPGFMAGFMANRNHMATLCLVSIPFSAALIGKGLRRGADGRKDLWAGAVLAAIAVLALGAIRSRFGIVIALPTLLASAAILWRAAGRRRPAAPLLALAGSVGVVLTVVLAIGMGPILERFDSAGSQEGRADRWPTVSEAAQSYLPTGAGFGSFNRVYRSVEPLEEVDSTFFNRAHNDYLETWLEAGWAAVAVLVAFLVWFVRRAVTAWRQPPSAAADIRRAGSVGILVILAHSAVDYPLRTVAIAALLAALAALLEAEDWSSDGADRAGRLRVRRRTP